MNDDRYQGCFHNVPAGTTTGTADGPNGMPRTGADVQEAKAQLQRGIQLVSLLRLARVRMTHILETATSAMTHAEVQMTRDVVSQIEAAFDSVASIDQIEPKPPKSPIEITLTIGAETPRDLYWRLRNELNEWSETEPPHFHIWGGAGTHGELKVDLRDITPEQYRKELDDWFQARKAVKARK